MEKRERLRPPDPRKAESRVAAAPRENDNDSAGSTNNSGSAKGEQAVALRDHEHPEFGTSRRRFLIAMFMSGVVPGQRVVERVVADIAANAM